MRVRIKKAGKPGYWYRLHIGQVFNVEPTPASQDDYRVVGVGPTGTACWIDKSDCVRVVRVPKELRPPALQFVERESSENRGFTFRAIAFRKPIRGEFYWYANAIPPLTLMAYCDNYKEPQVILERVP